MTGPLAFGVDVGVDDVAVVVFHRTAGGCWQVESVTGGEEDVAAVMAAADLPARKLPDQLQPERSVADLAAEWMREHARENFALDAEQLDLLRRMYARQMATGTLVHVTTDRLHHP